MICCYEFNNVHQWGQPVYIVIHTFYKSVLKILMVQIAEENYGQTIAETFI